MKEQIKGWIGKTIIIGPIDNELNSEMRRNLKELDNPAVIGIIGFFKTIYYAQFFAYLGVCFLIALTMFIPLLIAWLFKTIIGKFTERAK